MQLLRINRPFPAAIALAMLVALLVILLVAPAASGASTSLVINEIDYDQPGTDDAEFIELKNVSGSDIDLTGWTLEFVNGSNDTIYRSFTLAVTLGPGDYYVVCGIPANVPNCDLDVTPNTNLIQNGSPDAVALRDDNGTLIDTVSYEGDTGAPYTEGSGERLFDSTSTADVGISRCPDGFDSDQNNLDLLSARGITPGTTNNCTISLTPIYDIQGATHYSPFAGDIVDTSGIVTAVAFDGYYVQDPYGDGDEATSDGIFVFMDNFCNGCPDVGDEILLIDNVSEFIPGGPATGNLSITEFAFGQVIVQSTGNDLPEPVIIGRGGRIPPTVMVISPDEIDPPINLQDPIDAAANPFNPDEDGIDFFESLEGMRVTVEDAVAVSAVRSFGSFSSELFTLANNGHPDVIDPNNVRTDRGGINLAADADGYGDLNPERVQIQFDASDIRTGTLFPSTVPTINVGDRLGDVTGVVGYDFGNYEVRATLDFTTTGSLLEPESTSLAGTKKAVTVASYNVLNLSPLASDDNQRAKLGSQIANNLGGPDVVALQEIQDNNGDISDCEDENSEEFCEELAETGDGVVDATETLQLLVDSIAAAGGPSYEFFNVNPPEGSSGGIPLGNIRNAFLYNPDRVELDGFVSLTETILSEVGADPNAFFDTRKPLAATFVFEGETFTVINNHLSSRSGSTPIFGGPQPFVQAAEDERESQVDALNRYVDFLLEDDKDARVIVLGDFNTFEFTNDLTEILPGTLDGRAIMKSILDEIEDDNRYTFIFDGNSQVLDHMFATRSLLEEARFDIVHVNVDFSRLFLDTTASDHEPIVGLYDLSSK